MAKLLIIDDEASIRRTLKEILEFENYTVDVAEDGVQGVAAAKKTTYDAIFCDIKMPQMNGYEVLNELHNKHKKSIVFNSLLFISLNFI